MIKTEIYSAERVPNINRATANDLNFGVTPAQVPVGNMLIAKRLTRQLLFLTVFLAATIFVTPQSIAGAYLTGQAAIVDGDTIKIAGIPIRLEGIDAPETRQTCRSDSKKEIACGLEATKALSAMIDGREVSCELLGLDDLKERQLGRCSVDGESLNERMVRDGWALAFVKYSDQFTAVEQNSRSRKVGLWRWSFEKPWDWRLGVSRQAVGERGGESECAIKGNISRAGERIYHMPFHTFYGRTRIDVSKGERWFCTERDALAAGWRRALR